MIDPNLIRTFQRILDKLADAGKLELAQQGHRATGKGIESVEGVVSDITVDKLVGVIMANDYLLPVDTGVKASRIAYNPGSGTRTSKYIEGLIRWAGVVKPSLSPKERKSFAFAVAAKHKREGMPTRASFSFSRNGRRKDWVKFGLADNVDAIVEAANMLEVFERQFDKALQNIAA